MPDNSEQLSDTAKGRLDTFIRIAAEARTLAIKLAIQKFSLMHYRADPSISPYSPEELDLLGVELDQLIEVVGIGSAIDIDSRLQYLQGIQLVEEAFSSPEGTNHGEAD